MAVDHARDIIRDIIDESDLTEFEKQVQVVDELTVILERETDPDKAYALAIAWASSLLSLARIESALLAAILPQFKEELEEASGQITALMQRKYDAESAVRELRGPDHDVMPLSVKTDPRRTKEIAETKESRDQVFAEVRVKMESINVDRRPLMLSIGAIERTLRALHHFTLHRFPIPNRKGRNPMAPVVQDQHADPLAAFAEKYVDGMESRGSKEAQALRAGRERTRIADARPARDWKKIKLEEQRARTERKAEYVQ